MAKIIAMLVIAASAVLLLPAGNALLAADLIEPTRTLNGAGKPEGKLTVSSEPPGLPVSLDGLGVGKTPISLNEVKAGIHHLQVGTSATEIVVDPGQTMDISLFKGSFIKIPEPAPEPSNPPTTVPTPPPEPKPAPAQTEEQLPAPMDSMERKRLHGYF